MTKPVTKRVKKAKPPVIPPPPPPTRLERVKGWVALRARTFTLSYGLVIISLWTLLRHITNGINYDVVGQIGLVQQWAAGFHSGVQLGATSYLIKFPLYYALNQLTFLVPIHRLLLAALICNLLTFVLLFILTEKIIRLYRPPRPSSLYLGLAWLATISGSVFWVDYANSRNLETVGGMLFIYFVLKIVQQRKPRDLLWLILIGSLTFFADPLQLYAVGLGTCVFAGLLILYRRRNWILSAEILAATGLGYLYSRGLTLAAQQILHVNFIKVPNNHPHYTTANLPNILHDLLLSTLKIFDADIFKRPVSANTVRELINLLILVFVTTFLVKVILKPGTRKPAILIFSILVTNYLVYVLSGQVIHATAPRYIIMVPLLTILLLGLSSLSLGSDRWWRKGRYLCLLAVLLSGLMLLGALAISWPTRHSKDAYIGPLIAKLEAHNFEYALSSREIGITTSYFSDSRLHVLPMACGSDHRLSPTNQFYDDAVFSTLKRYKGQVPIILQSDNIQFGANTCTRQDIEKQFGRPLWELGLMKSDTALVYDASAIYFDEANVSRPRHGGLGVTSSVPLKPIADAESSLGKLEGCTHGTIDVVIAHPDDDILFINPSVSAHIKDKCIRSVYVTAADDGRNQTYWKQREHGVEAAYALMLGADNSWSDETVTIDGHQMLQRHLIGHPSVSLLFMHLPDGGVHGQGFLSTGHESLERLADHSISVLKPVDDSSGYTYGELSYVLGVILNTDKPEEIYTHVFNGLQSIGDHSDHRNVGKLTMIARNQVAQDTPVRLYLGYPSNGLPPNLSRAAAEGKRTIFNAYAPYDSMVCASYNTCSYEHTYGKYFSRSYKIKVSQQSDPNAILSEPSNK